MKAHVLFATMLLTACDPGGSIPEYISRVDNADARQEIIAIPTYCLSACALYLAADHSCVRPSTRVGLHGVFLPREFRNPRTQRTNELIYMNRLPSYLQEIWWNNARQLGRNSFYWVSGTELIELGARQCLELEKPHE